MVIKGKHILTLFTVALFLASCSPSKEEKRSEISVQEENLYSDEGLSSKEGARELIEMYISYAEEYPEDSNAVEYLFKAADIAMNIFDSQKAIYLYDKIYSDYPTFRKRPECLFLKGYVYENNLGQLDEAKAIYTEFLQKYPDNDFADDAEVSLNNLGKSPEELIKEFEEKMKENEEPE